jgi:hypothetical protein
MRFPRFFFHIDLKRALVGILSKHKMMLHGIYTLKVSPNEFTSLKEYLLHVKRENNRTFTDEQFLEYLDYLLKDNHSLGEHDERIFISHILTPLELFDFTVDDSLSFYEKKEQASLFIKNQIDKIMKNKQHRTPAKPFLMYQKAIFVVAAGIVVLMTLGSAVVRKNINKK